MTIDHRHEEHVTTMEIYLEGLEAHWDDFETEDLLLNLIHATGEDRAVILELLEVRGMKAVKQMSEKERCDHFNGLTNDQMREATFTPEALGEWDRLTWMALALAAISRLNGLIGEPDLETVDVLAAQRRMSEAVSS